ncbi:MAG: hypothetical protein ACE5KG_01440 [Nitrososphaerales archaeon]
MTYQKQKIIKVSEGRTTLFLPESSLESSNPSYSTPFYNPKGGWSRDLSISLYSTLAMKLSRRIIFGDIFAGVGARGVRVANEIPRVDEVYLNDQNKDAIKFAKKSASLNDVEDKCQFYSMDASHFMAAQAGSADRFSIVDIDPFGSPAAFIESGLRCVVNGGIISLTGTDSTVLCGVYPKIAKRRYSGYSLRTDYCHEVGLRLLYGALAVSAARLDLGISPLFAHRDHHYMRICSRISAGSRVADTSISNMGLILHCNNCMWRETSKTPVTDCAKCGHKYQIAGPLWLGELHDPKLLKTVVSNKDPTLGQRHYDVLNRAIGETGMLPTYYVVDVISKRSLVSSPKLSPVLEALEAEGFRASRSSIHPRGVRTDASADVLSRIIKKLAS